MSAKPRIRIALFLCDTPIPAVQTTDGDYIAIFDRLLRNSLPSNSQSEYILDPYDVRNKQEYPAHVDEYNAIILTGSAASAYDNLDWINHLVKYVADVGHNKPDVKLIGICFGHQIIARAMGGECVPNNGKWEIGITTVDLTPLGQLVFGAPTLNIQQMHRDHVPSVPPSFLLLGSTEITPNQGMIRFLPSSESQPAATLPFSSLKDVQIITVQGHPEFTQRISSTIIDARTSTGAIDAATAKDARRRADLRNDGVTVIGSVIWRVLGVEA